MQTSQPTTQPSATPTRHRQPGHGQEHPLAADPATSRRRLRRPQRFRERYGPWAIVTGASSGIGRETALVLADAGLDLVLVARRRGPLDQLATDLTRRHRLQVRVLDIDLARPDGPERLDAATGDLDVGLLVAAAGFGTSGPFLDADLDQELELLDVNCRAVLAGSLHSARRLARRGRGGIVLLASLVGRQGTPGAAHYAATKAYVQTLAEALHQELAPAGIDVVAAAPGPVHSGFAARAGMHMTAALDPTDVAAATLEALGRRAVVTPGALSKLLTWSLLALPRQARVRVMGAVMGRMTTHRQPHR